MRCSRGGISFVLGYRLCGWGMSSDLSTLCWKFCTQRTIKTEVKQYMQSKRPNLAHFDATSAKFIKYWTVHTATCTHCTYTVTFHIIPYRIEHNHCSPTASRHSSYMQRKFFKNLDGKTTCCGQRKTPKTMPTWVIIIVFWWLSFQSISYRPFMIRPLNILWLQVYAKGSLWIKQSPQPTVQKSLLELLKDTK